jgi:serine/threonine-protein kinase
MASSRDAGSGPPGADAASVIKVCFKCKAVYRTRRDTCPRDGSPLTRADLEPGTMLAGKYRIIERIGQGGMGIVYRAEHVVMGKLVAVKVLNPLLSEDPKFLEMFKAEARLASSFRHPNVLTVHDFGEDNGRFYLVMQLLEGKSIKTLLDERKSFPPERAFAILLKICDAVAAAHRCMIIHLDLKGENVFLMEGPGGDDVKVLDFGLAQLSGSGPHGLDDEMTIGTVGYMAPEQIMGKTVDARADVYSLGVLAFEMLTGELPFPGRKKNDILSSQLENEIRKWPKLPHLKFVPKETRAVIYSAFSSDPDRRPESVEALADAFQRALNVVRKRTRPHAGGYEAGPPRQSVFAKLGAAIKRLVSSEPVRPPAPEGMVFVPGGEFKMGSGSGNLDERPSFRQHCEPFYIDVTPVTNLQYAKFVQATDHKPPTTWKTLSFPPGTANLPVTGITWQDAANYCAWAGKRLPTEIEWERAARGRSGRVYPWGNSWEPTYANWGGNPRFYGGATIQPVGSFPNDKSSVGCMDMAGNVKEWTASWYKPYGPTDFKTDDFGEKYRVVRGGSYLSSDKQYLRSSHRSHMRPTDMGDVGFRCAMSVDK